MTERKPLYLNNGVTAQMADGDTIDPSLLPSSSAEWGNINGTLSNQTDLQTELNAKISDLSGFNTGDLAEGANQYFTNERAQDAVGNAVGESLSYDDVSGKINTIQNIRTTDSPTFSSVKINNAVGGAFLEFFGTYSGGATFSTSLSTRGAGATSGDLSGPNAANFLHIAMLKMEINGSTFAIPIYYSTGA